MTPSITFEDGKLALSDWAAKIAESCHRALILRDSGLLTHEQEIAIFQEVETWRQAVIWLARLHSNKKDVA